MAWYVAHHHLGLDNYIAHPGEVFEADFTPENEARLLKLKAIEKIDMAIQPEETAAEFGLKVLAEEEEEFAALSERENSDEDEPDENGEAEAFEAEPEPMEIDVAEAVKPAKRGRKKNAD